MIEPGNYKARAVEGALGRTQNGNPQIAVVFALTEGEHKGESYTWYGYFGPKPETAERTIQSLRYCGWKGDDLSELDGPFAGRADDEVTVVIEHNEYNGNVTPRVAWVNSGAGPRMANRMTAAEAKAFAKTMMGTVVSQRQKQAGSAAKHSPPRTAPKPAQPTPAPQYVHGDGYEGDDEIPF